MKPKFHKLLYEFNLATDVATHYAYLIGNHTFPILVGKNTIEVTIDEIVVEPFDDAGCRIKLVSKLNNIQFRSAYLTLGLHSIDLADYLKLKGNELDYEIFGIGFCKLTPERSNGIDLYL